MCLWFSCAFPSWLMRNDLSCALCDFCVLLRGMFVLVNCLHLCSPLLQVLWPLLSWLSHLRCPWPWDREPPSPLSANNCIPQVYVPLCVIQISCLPDAKSPRSCLSSRWPCRNPSWVLIGHHIAGLRSLASILYSWEITSKCYDMQFFMTYCAA